MASKPSLSTYIGGTAFLLMLATLVAAGVGQAVDSAVVTVGSFVLLVSAAHVTVMYFMVEEWIEYAAEELFDGGPTSSDGSGASTARPDGATDGPRSPDDGTSGS